MKITNIDPNEIIVDERIRKTFDNISKLASSIKEHGIIQPLVLDDANHLIAGERRLRASKELGLRTVPTVRRSAMEEWQKVAIELEENIQREELSYKEQAFAREKIHRLYQEHYGTPLTPTSRNDGMWHEKDTAELLGLAQSTINEDLQLAEAIRNDHDIAKAETRKGAVKLMYKKRQQGIESVLADVLAETADALGEKARDLIMGSSDDILPTLEENSFSFCFTDPPYFTDIGKGQIDRRNDVIGGAYGTTFEDGLIQKEEVAEVFRKLYPLLIEGAHLYVCTSTMREKEMREIVLAAGFRIASIPIVWYKKHSGALAFNDPYHQRGSCYEHILYCWKGNARAFTEQTSPPDVLDFPVDGGSDKIHLAQKPVALISNLITNCSLSNEKGIDPFAGSGSFLLACQETGRRGVGVEKDKSMCVKSWARLEGERDGTN